MPDELFLFDNESIVTTLHKCTTFCVIAYRKDFRLRLYIMVLSKCIWDCASHQQSKKRGKKKLKERKYNIF